MEITGTHLEALEKRVAGLERQNRWMKRAGSTIFLLLASVLLMGQARQPQAARARNFSLLDSKGRVVAELKTESDGIPSLSFYDDKGESNLTLLGGDVPGVVVGTDGHSMADLRAPSFGKDAQGKNTGASALKLFDAEGNLRVELGAFKSGPSLDFDDADGYTAILGTRDITTPRTRGQNKTSAASLLLLDKDNKVIWSAP